MFYAHFVLCKKGPLARIWLAAHWDKKLTRVHVMETNIASSVQEILEPKVKMALRTSGHLMLGVVRIYSHKARYLLNDCNQVFVKIKMSFRPGQSDEMQTIGLDEASDENTRTLMANVIGSVDSGSLTIGSGVHLNISDDIHDFEATIADLSRVDREILDVNQSRPEDITMRDDVGSEINFGRHDDDFGDSYVPERARGGTVEWLTNDSLQIHSTSDLNVGRKRPSSDLELASSLLNKRMHHDDDLDDDNDLFGATDEDMVSLMDVLGANEMFDPTPNTPGIVTHTKIQNASNESLRIVEEDSLQVHQTANDTEVFPLNKTLEHPFVVPAPPASIRNGLHDDETPIKKSAKKKRRLIIDDQKSIPSETMKAQMRDTSDITVSLDLAPPTRKLMQWKEAGGVDRLLSLPGRTISARCLQRLFQRNLRSISRPQPSADQQIFFNSPNTSVVNDISCQDNSNLQLSTVSEEVARLANSDVGHVEAPSSIWMVDSLNLTEIQTPSLSHAGIQLPDDLLSPGPSVGFDINQFPDQTPVRFPPETPAYPPDSVYQPREDEDLMMSALDEELFNTDFGVNGDDGVDDALTNPNDEQAAEERRLEKKSQVLLKMVQSIFDREESGKTTFAALSKCNIKKMAATKFYTLLLLCKQKAVLLEQHEPFMDIYISKGELFHALLKA